MSKHIKRIPLYAVLFIIALFLIIWLSSLVKCEILTNKYYEDFRYAYQSNTMISGVQYFKVLNCDGKVAEVYYVSDSKGDVLNFELRDGMWKETRWKTIWSKRGSASDIVWPYWWQFFITGF